jgi:hypothetical protein
MAAGAVVRRGEHGLVVLQESLDCARIEVRAVRQDDDRPGDVVAERRDPAAQRGTGALLPVLAVHDPGLRCVNTKFVRALDHHDLVDRGARERVEHRRQKLALLDAAVP